MFFKDQGRLPDSGFLLSAGLGWLIGAAFFLLAATLIANAAGIGERGLGYLSSAISFLAAVTAGVSAGRRRLSAGFTAVLLTAAALVTLLLTVGFMINGEEMNASAILSIVTFTYTGVAVGMLIHPKRHGKKYQVSKLT